MVSLPTVSILVPVFNQEKYIGRCLRSLLSQDFPRVEYEIIVVNDGSTDKTDYALDLFKEDVRIIRNEENIGLPASLNKAIRSSKAPYVVRVDSDDYVNNLFLKFLTTFLSKNQYMDAIACDYYIVDDNEVISERRNCLLDPIACGIIFRKEQLIDIGLYDEAFLLHEERDLRFRFDEKYKVYRLELPLYRYRKHKNNITNNKTSMDEHMEKLLRKHGKGVSK